MTMESVRINELEAINNEFRATVVNNIPCRSNQLEKSLQSITDYINKRKSGIMEEGQVELVKRYGDILGTTLDALKMIGSGEPIQVMKGGLSVAENISSVIECNYGPLTGACCGVLAESLLAPGLKHPDTVTKLTDIVHWEFKEFKDDASTEKLIGLNTQIRSLKDNLNSLNSTNIDSKFDWKSWEEMCHDFEVFMTEILDVFEAPLTTCSEKTAVDRFLVTAVTFCFASTCFQVILAACLAKKISIKILYGGSNNKLNRMRTELGHIRKLLDAQKEKSRSTLRFLSDKKYLSESLLEPYVATRAGKIFHIRINLHEFNIVEAFRSCLQLPAMPSYEEVRTGVLQRMLKNVRLNTDEYYLPSKNYDHHYFQLINETKVPIKIVSGIAGDDVNSLKFIVNVDPQSEFHTAATRNGPIFSTGGCIFVYLNGINRPDNNPESQTAKKLGFAVDNIFDEEHRYHLVPAGDMDADGVAMEAWTRITDSVPSPIYWEVPGSPPRYYVASCEHLENQHYDTYRFIIADYCPYKQADLCNIL